MVHSARSLTQCLEQVSERIWRLAFFFPATVNCWIYIDDDDELTLIDAAQPWNHGAISSTIKQFDKPLKRIVITHAHPDHAGSAAALANETGASVFAHTMDLPFLTGASCMSNERGYWMCRALLKTGSTLGWLKSPQISAVQSVNEGGSIGTLRVLHTPGHTPGSISLWSESERALFCGDNISNALHLLRLNFSLFTLNFETLRQSIERCTDLPAQIILPGHGPAFRHSNCMERVRRLLPDISTN